MMALLNDQTQEAEEERVEAERLNSLSFSFGIVFASLHALQGKGQDGQN